MAYLPNRKIFFSLIFILLVFAGWLFFYKNEKSGLLYIAKENSGSNALEVAARETLSVDTDNDGLHDWEEALWKTDPQNPDTDNDGALDGEEVNLNRDPLKPGPDDKISMVLVNTLEQKESLIKSNDSLTDNYAKKFLTDYLTLKNQKGELSEEDKTILIDSLTENITASTEITETYKISDLNISEDVSKEAVKKYSDNVRKILINVDYFPEDAENEIIIFNRLLTNYTNKGEESEEVKADVEKLNAMADVYKEANNRLVAVLAIPGLFLSQHITLLNSFNSIENADKHMALLASDPVKALSGFDLYQKEMKNAYGSIGDIEKILNNYELSLF